MDLLHSTPPCADCTSIQDFRSLPIRKPSIKSPQPCIFCEGCLRARKLLQEKAGKNLQISCTAVKIGYKSIGHKTLSFLSLNSSNSKFNITIFRLSLGVRTECRHSGNLATIAEMLKHFCAFVVGPRPSFFPTVTNDRRPTGMENQ